MVREAQVAKAYKGYYTSLWSEGFSNPMAVMIASSSFWTSAGGADEVELLARLVVALLSGQPAVRLEAGKEGEHDHATEPDLHEDSYADMSPTKLR